MNFKGILEKILEKKKLVDFSMNFIIGVSSNIFLLLCESSLLHNEKKVLLLGFCLKSFCFFKEKSFCFFKEKGFCFLKRKFIHGIVFKKKFIVLTLDRKEIFLTEKIFNLLVKKSKLNVITGIVGYRVHILHKYFEFEYIYKSEKKYWALKENGTRVAINEGIYDIMFSQGKHEKSFAESKVFANKRLKELGIEFCKEGALKEECIIYEMVPLKKDSKKMYFVMLSSGLRKRISKLVFVALSGLTKILTYNDSLLWKHSDLVAIYQANNYYFGVLSSGKRERLEKKVFVLLIKEHPTLFYQKGNIRITSSSYDNRKDPVSFRSPEHQENYDKLLAKQLARGLKKFKRRYLAIGVLFKGKYLKAYKVRYWCITVLGIKRQIGVKLFNYFKADYKEVSYKDAKAFKTGDDYSCLNEVVLDLSIAVPQWIIPDKKTIDICAHIYLQYFSTLNLKDLFIEPEFPGTKALFSKRFSKYWKLNRSGNIGKKVSVDFEHRDTEAIILFKNKVDVYEFPRVHIIGCPPINKIHDFLKKAVSISNRSGTLIGFLVPVAFKVESDAVEEALGLNAARKFETRGFLWAEGRLMKFVVWELQAFDIE